MADEEQHSQGDKAELDAYMRREYERAMKAQERAELVQEAIRRLQEIQARDEAAAQWVEQHEQEAETAAAELQQAFVDAAVSWLEERWGPERPCPYCENPQWSVGTPFEVSLESGESLSPHFPVMCTNCGNTVFVNAILAGLLPETEPEEEPDE